MNESDSVRYTRSVKAAKQRLKEQALCRIDPDSDPREYMSMGELPYPFAADPDMADRTTPEDMAYVDELTREVLE